MSAFLTISIPATLGMAHIAGDEIVHAFQNFSQVAAASLLSTLWQGALLAGLLAIGIKLAPRTTAAVRFALWSITFLAVLLLPLLGLLSPQEASGSSLPSVAGSTAHVAPWLQLDVRWSLVFGLVWIAASLFRAVRLAIHSVRLTRLWRSAQPVPADEIPHVAFTRRKFQVCTTTQLERPGVIGFFAPRILIPEWLYAQLSPSEIRQVVLHELEHLRRRDDWTNLVQRLSLVLFPLNPVLFWIERQLCAEREMACDEGVIHVTHAPRAYATCLTKLAERGLGHRSEALSLGAWQRRPELARRVHSILRTKQALRPRGSQALIAGVACSLAFASVELSHAPQFVAFVPTPAHSTLAASATALPAAHLANASLSGTLRSNGPGKPYLTEARALMPIPAGTPIHSSVKHASMRPSHLAPSSPADPVSIASRAPEQAQEQWIVLTTWEQNSAVGDHAQLQNQTQPAAIVTQVVFRIVTRESASPTLDAPNAAQPNPLRRAVVSWPPHSGWLIFQL